MSEMILYTAADGGIQIKVTLEDETVWLTLDQMAQLFGRDKSTVSRHIKNIFEEGELQRDSVVANFATTASDGKTEPHKYNAKTLSPVEEDYLKAIKTLTKKTKKKISL